jgi:hypothetical protein
MPRICTPPRSSNEIATVEIAAIVIRRFRRRFVIVSERK